ncbi:Dynein Heavy Chain 9, Axonemal [Manis pentadactyla]|nr:Dynein Heavy Chain 9, Axonemal [Manis pentadactyla]
MQMEKCPSNLKEKKGEKEGSCRGMDLALLKFLRRPGLIPLVLPSSPGRTSQLDLEGADTLATWQCST